MDVHFLGGSSNGRTADSGSAYRGSNPCPPAIESRKLQARCAFGKRAFYVVKGRGGTDVAGGCTISAQMPRMVQINGAWSIPKFQRGFVWKSSEVRNLLESLWLGSFARNGCRQAAYPHRGADGVLAPKAAGVSSRCPRNRLRTTRRGAVVVKTYHEEGKRS